MDMFMWLDTHVHVSALLFSTLFLETVSLINLVLTN